MIRRTLGQAKAKLARISGTSGFKMNDARVVDRINEATEELMNEGEWPGVVDRYLFSSTTGDIILPGFLDRIVGVALNDLPYSIRSPWYEFVEYGPGPQSAARWIDAVIDRDETPIQIAFPGTGGPYSLYTKCELDERVDGVRPTLLVRGRYANKRIVRSFFDTGYIDGEELYLDGDTPPYTFYGTAQFTEITSVEKPETNGYVELWATNGTPSQDVLLASYAPGETNPSYHAYFVPNLHNLWIPPPPPSSGQPMQILVRGRRRFIAVEEDEDQLIISNLPAMISMLMAIQKREVSDVDGYMTYKAAAVDILKKEALGYRGKVKAPAISFDSGAMGDFIYVR